VKGLFYGGGTDQLVGQLIGSAAVTTATFAVGMLLMYAVKATGTLRVSRQGEIEGLDLHEHGGPAYPEQMGGFSSTGPGLEPKPARVAGATQPS
jgi:Amt family ammonium transporter